MPELGRLLLVLGVVIVLVGLFLMLGLRLPWLGRLPGDIVIRRDHGTFYFPIVTCLVVSIILSIIFSLFFRR